MTADTESFNRPLPEQETDELLRAYIASRLGDEAARRALMELRRIDDLSQRIEYLGRAAAWLDMITESTANTQADVGGVDTVVRLPVDEQPSVEQDVQTAHVAKETEVLEVYESVIPQEAVKTEESAADVVPVASREVQEDDYQVDPRIRYALGKLCGKDTVDELELGPESVEAVAGFIVDLRGEEGLRSNSPDMRPYITMVYNGWTAQEIADATGSHNAASVNSRWSNYMKKVEAVARERDEDTLALLQSYLNQDNEPRLEIEARPTVIESERKDAEVSSEATPLRQESESVQEIDVNEQLDELIDALCTESPEHAESVRALVSEEQYDSERMGIGRTLLSELVERYANNRADARNNLGEIDEAAYRALCDLAGSGARGKVGNRLPRTLSTVVKFNPDAEDQVLEHLVRLLRVATNEAYEPVAAPVAPSPAVMPRNLEVVRSEPEYTPEPVDLFAVAKGEVKVGKGDWNTATEEFFDSLSKRDIMKNVEAQMLKDRIFEHEVELDDVTRRVLNMLQRRSLEPGSRINEDQQVRDAFNMFTTTAFGANGVKYIAEKLSRTYGKEVRAHTIERRIIGGIAAVLGQE